MRINKINLFLLIFFLLFVPLMASGQFSLNFDAGFLGVNNSDVSNVIPYIYPEIKYNLVLTDWLGIYAGVNYYLEIYDDMKDSRGNDILGWSWLGIDAGFKFHFLDNFYLNLSHEIDYQLTPDYNRSAAAGNRYKGLIGIEGEYRYDLDYDSYMYINLYLPVTYMQVSGNVNLKTDLQSIFGIKSFSGIGMWARMDFEFSDEPDNGITYRGMAFRLWYDMENFSDIPMYTHIEIGFLNIDNYGMDIIINMKYRFLDNLALWFEFEDKNIFNKLDKDPVMNLRMGLILTI
ncbi:MAG: porin family protein [Treponema sp.]|nr:porin family protein [Treponema sp.]